MFSLGYAWFILHNSSTLYDETKQGNAARDIGLDARI
jgi:hypothetical protein